MILLLTKDLFFVPIVRTAAAKLGVEVAVVLSIESDKLQTLPTESVTAWVVDLNSVTLEDLPSVVDNLSQRFPTAKRVAFGPHVQEQRLQAARDAGCQQVLSRGQLDSQIDRLIHDWIAT